MSKSNEACFAKESMSCVGLAVGWQSSEQFDS